MAGDWMKIEKVTPDKPEIEAMASLLGIDPDAVFGKLFRIWCWFDDHTTNGNAPSVTKSLLDRKSTVSGFGDAMEKVGWLAVTDKGLTLPRFDRHCGETAKRRALTAKRVAKSKAKKGNAKVTHGALPREEKRREEKSNKNRERFHPPTVEEVAEYCRERSNQIDPSAFVDFYTANGWVQGRNGKSVKDWKACVRTWEQRHKQEVTKNARPEPRLVFDD